MQGLRIRTKIFLVMIAVLLLFIGGTVLVVHRWVEQVYERQVSDMLQRGVLAYDHFVALRAEIVTNQARSMAQTPLLKAVINIPEVDAETVFYTVRELYEVVDVNLMLLVDVDGLLLVDAAADDRAGADLRAEPGVAAGLRGAEYSGVWSYRDRLYHIALTPIIIEGQMLGLLVLGNPLHEVAEMRESTGKDVILLRESEVVAQSWEHPPSGSLGRGEIDDLVDLIRGDAGERRPMHALLAGRQCLAIAVPLRDVEGHVVLFRGLDELEDEVDQLELSMAGMGALAAVLAVFFSLWFSARLSRPIRELSAMAEQVGDGQIVERARVYADDELGRLVQSFNAMVDRVAEHTRTLQQEVNERRRAEQERASLEEQMRQSQKLEAIGILAGGIAHDFNNLLMVVLGFSEMLLNSLEADDPRYQFAEQIHGAGDRGAALVRQLVAFGRRQILQPRVLDFNRLIGDMGKMLPRLLGEDVELLTSCGREVGCVYADPGQIEQVVMNLVVNARDAMPDGGTVTIETAATELSQHELPLGENVRPGPFVKLGVNDTGGGMDAETQARIFDPFFTTKAVDRGTGLGLSTVYGIVKQSGGFIQVDSEPGRGTTFEIYMPRVEAQAEAQTEAGGEEEEGKADAASPGMETVLLVEDEELVRNLVRQVLRQNRYRVVEAANGVEALRTSEEYAGTIDLLLVDVVMPEMNGAELVRRLEVQRPQMKVLYMSGYSDEALFQRGGVEMERALLPKPFAPEVLLRRVREVLAGGGERVV